jgi:hypothetical protein
MPIGDKIHNIEINDSEFEREGWKNSRYKGTKLTGAKINEFNRGDITYGLNPVIEQYSRAVYVFNYVQDSFEALSGQFYPTTDEFSQTLPDKTIIGCAKFKIDRAIVFEIGNTNNHTQISPGVDNKDPNYYYFDTLMKTDLSIHSSCSVRFFDNANNGFTKPFYIVGHNQGDFTPAAAYFISASTGQPTVSASAGNDRFTYAADHASMSGSRFYINGNSEEWYISDPNASGSAGGISFGNEAITIDHNTGQGDVNSVAGYFVRLSKRLKKTNDKYYISFNKGDKGSGSLNEKITLKAYDIHKLAYSGSGDDQNIDIDLRTFKIQTTGRGNSPFIGTYRGPKQEYVLFKEVTTNDTIHLDFNTTSEMPAGVGNGGIIIPNNLHPEIKEQLNIYLLNAGLGPQGGTSQNFDLGEALAREKERGQSRFQTFSKIDEAFIENFFDTDNKADPDDDPTLPGDDDDDDGGGNLLDGGSNLAPPSDIRLKENIIFLRKSLSGIPIYKFNYKGKSETYTGTMAQDLLKLGLDKAVIKNSNGYYSVDYSLIDVDMKKV